MNFRFRKLCLLPMTLVLFCLGCRTVAVDSLHGQNPAQNLAQKTYLIDLKADFEKCWPTNRIIHIVCHGHSVPAGYFKTPAVHTFDAYPALLHRALAERYRHAVINVVVTAIGGENSESGAARFERDVLALHPDVITIDYALNDRGIGLPRAEAAWRKMITQAQTHGVKIILLTPTPDTAAHLDDPNNPLNQHARQIRRLAEEYKTGLVDSLDAFRQKTNSGTALTALMSQGNHPNRRGHDLIVAELLQWFR
ncbi:MAG: SGNH/GDSL hydrolase family protein [Limisphaerales bacterium]